MPAYLDVLLRLSLHTPAVWHPDDAAIYLLVALFRERLHRTEQYVTSGQARCHFFRQLKGRWQTGHNLLGNSDFFIVMQSG